jgi:hypothetical protein
MTESWSITDLATAIGDSLDEPAVFRPSDAGGLVYAWSDDEQPYLQIRMDLEGLLLVTARDGKVQRPAFWLRPGGLPLEQARDLIMHYVTGIANVI